MASCTAEKRCFIIIPSTLTRQRKFSVGGDNNPVLRPIHKYNQKYTSFAISRGQEQLGTRARTISIGVDGFILKPKVRNTEKKVTRKH